MEVLQWIRQDPALDTLVVLMFTSSELDLDVHSAYRFHANGYLVKPPLVSELQRIVRLIKQYWLDSEGPPPDCREWEAIIVAPPPATKAKGERLKAEG